MVAFYPCPHAYLYPPPYLLPLPLSHFPSFPSPTSPPFLDPFLSPSLFVFLPLSASLSTLPLSRQALLSYPASFSCPLKKKLN